MQDNDSSLYDKTIACRELAIVGTEASIPALVELLSDEHLSHVARYGLEPIPATKVDEAFVEAISTLQGKHLIGVINSIANRGKANAIGPVSQKLGGQNREVAKAVANCLGRLGTPRSAEILGKALSSEFAPAALVCARTLTKQGHADEATALISKMLALDTLPPSVHEAAMIQLIEWQGSKDLPLLIAALGAKDESHVNAGLRAARLIDSRSAAQAVSAVLEDSSPAQTASLITLLGDLAEPDSLSAVLKATESEHIEIRTAALGALSTLGNADHVPLLLSAAGDDSVPVATSAQQTLMQLQGEEVDQAILRALQDDALRSTAILMVGKHRITAGLPELLEMLDGPHQIQVVAALGETVSLSQLDVLGRLVLDSSRDSDADELRTASAAAIHAACQRMPNRDATVATLVGYLSEAPEEAVRILMDELRQIGGKQALEAVAVAARGDDEILIDYATQALGGWLDKSAAPILLELAKAEGSSNYGIRAVRGYIRLCRQFPMSDEERADMCRTALQIASRASEKKLVLKVLQKYPSVTMLKIGIEMAKDPELKKDAVPVARSVGSKLDQKSDEVKALLEQLDNTN